MDVRLAADLVVSLHAAFVLFVVFGGLLATKWPRAAWVHIPCFLWGAWVEMAGWLCPLTPLENLLREHGGEAAYQVGFIEHYLLPVLYPEGLTRTIQICLGLLMLLGNLFLYAALFQRRRRRHCRNGLPPSI